MATPTFFATPAEFRTWLDAHHEHATELLVGFHKKGSGKLSITWPESVDEALCVGCIDGVRKSIDHESYTIRFTPRKPDSNWSAINIRRVEELTNQGRMRPAGLRAFAQRQEAKSAIYAYERAHAELDAASVEQFRANKQAWDFFQTQAAWYRRNAIYWVVSAKREETRQKRLATLIADSASRRTIRHLTRPEPR